MVIWWIKGYQRSCIREMGSGKREVVIESKSFYNRFVDFAFSVVENWKAAKDAKSAKGVVEGRGKLVISR